MWVRSIIAVFLVTATALLVFGRSTEADATSQNDRKTVSDIGRDVAVSGLGSDDEETNRATLSELSEMSQGNTAAERDAEGTSAAAAIAGDADTFGFQGELGAQVLGTQTREEREAEMMLAGGPDEWTKEGYGKEYMELGADGSAEMPALFAESEPCLFDDGSLYVGPGLPYEPFATTAECMAPNTLPEPGAIPGPVQFAQVMTPVTPGLTDPTPPGPPALPPLFPNLPPLPPVPPVPPNPVPLPLAAWPFLTGLAGFVGLRMKRRKAAA